MREKVFLIAGLTALLVGVSACGDDESPAEEPPAEVEGGQEDQAAPQPDLEGIPDVVATVNGNDISKDEFVSTYENQFQQMAAEAQMSGQDIDQEQLKQQTADSMVDTELLIQEADDRGLEATDEEIDETLTELAEQNGLGSADDFIAALGEQGMAEDEVMSQLGTQVKIDELIAEETGDVQPSDDELKALYDDIKAQQEGSGEDAEIPPFEDVKPQLEEQAAAEKESETVQTLLGELRDSAEVTINL